jgi:hypothetical protein
VLVLFTAECSFSLPYLAPISFPFLILRRIHTPSLSTSSAFVDHLFFSTLHLDMRCIFSLLSFVAAACAYQVTNPNTNQGWTTAGPNTVTWQRVDTDPATFTLLLVNQVCTPLLTYLLPHSPPLTLISLTGQDYSSNRPRSPHCECRRH